MTWAEQMLSALDAPASWSRERIRAEAEWSKIWRGPTGFAIVGARVVNVERKKRPIWRTAA